MSDRFLLRRPGLSRALRACGAAVALLAALAACGAPDRAPGSEDARAGAEALVVGAGPDDFLLDLNRQRLGMYPLSASLCETLVRLTPDFDVEPALARSWSYRGDGTFRFVLRSDVRFHDGRRVDARAVKYSLDRTAGTIDYSHLSSESVRVVDDTTVEVRPSRPNPRLVEQLVHPTYSIVAPGTDPAIRPVCTGPFRFEEYEPGERLVVARHDAYRGEPARLRRLTFRFLSDPNTRVLALRSGEVDLIMDVPPSLVGALEEEPSIRVGEAPPGAVIVLYTAVSAPAPHDLLSDARLRRAVAHAVGRRDLVEHVLEGRARRVSTVNPPAALGRHADRVRGIPHDPAVAERILEEAGWSLGEDGVRVRDGRRLRLELIHRPAVVERPVAEWVQAELGRVGIEVAIRSLDAGAFTERLNAGRFDLDLEMPNQNDADPGFLLALRWYSRSPVASVAHTAAGPAFDSLVERMLLASEPDEVRARAAAAMRHLVEEAVAAVPLAGVSRIYAWRSGVEGFVPHPARTHQSWDEVGWEP